MIRQEVFGRLADGRAVKSYTLANAHGETVQLLDMGATIHRICVRGSSGAAADVVLGAPDARALEQFSFAGSVIGRVANRIAFGRYEAEGKTVQLEIDPRDGHFLHGGSGNYAHRLFAAELREADNAVIFRLRDEGNCGYGCPAEAEVCYRFDDAGRLTLDYTLTAGGTTLLCPTNHAFFRLSGTDVRRDILRVAASRYAVKSPLRVPEGEIASVKDTPLDFQRPRIIGEALKAGGGRFFADAARPVLDDILLLEKLPGEPAAELYSPVSGRRLRVYTDMPALIVFTPFAEGRPGKDGERYSGYCAVCLETQFVPNAVNCHGFAIPLYHTGETLHTTTVFQFDAVPPQTG